MTQAGANGSVVVTIPITEMVSLPLPSMTVGPENRLAELLASMAWEECGHSGDYSRWNIDYSTLGYLVFTFQPKT